MKTAKPEIKTTKPAPVRTAIRAGARPVQAYV